MKFKSSFTDFVIILKCIQSGRRKWVVSIWQLTSIRHSRSQMHSIQHRWKIYIWTLHEQIHSTVTHIWGLGKFIESNWSNGKFVGRKIYRTEKFSNGKFIERKIDRMENWLNRKLTEQKVDRIEKWSNVEILYLNLKLSDDFFLTVHHEICLANRIYYWSVLQVNVQLRL